MNIEMNFKNQTKKAFYLKAFISIIPFFGLVYLKATKSELKLYLIPICIGLIFVYALILGLFGLNTFNHSLLLAFILNPLIYLSLYLIQSILFNS
jgi:hypothetical protein